jgi:hypothetical protein
MMALLVLYGDIPDSTHPDIATLVYSLFSFVGKRVKEFFFNLLSIFKSPLYAEGEERGVQRSVGRVSC